MTNLLIIPVNKGCVIQLNHEAYSKATTDNAGPDAPPILDCGTKSTIISFGR